MCQELGYNDSQSKKAKTQKTAPGFPGATTCAKKYKGNLEKFVGRTMVIEIP